MKIRRAVSEDVSDLLTILYLGVPDVTVIGDIALNSLLGRSTWCHLCAAALHLKLTLLQPVQENSWDWDAECQSGSSGCYASLPQHSLYAVRCCQSVTIVPVESRHRSTCDRSSRPAPAACRRLASSHLLAETVATSPSPVELRTLATPSLPSAAVSNREWPDVLHLHTPFSVPPVHNRQMTVENEWHCNLPLVVWLV